MTIDKILTVVELSDSDDALLNYVSFFSNRLGVKELCFMHILNEEELTTDQRRNAESLIEIIRKNIEQKVVAIPGLKDKTWKIVVEKGRIRKKILKRVEDENIDLIAIGFGENETLPDLFDETLIRDSTAGLLYVPATAPQTITNILIPIDFSRFSRRAMEKGYELAKITDAGVKCLNLLIPPKQYFPYITADEDEIEKLTKVAGKEYTKFLRGLEHKVPAIAYDYVVAGSSEMGPVIYEYALEHGFDMILVGSGAHSWLDAFFFDDMAEQVFSFDQKIPLLILKGARNYTDLLKIILKKAR